MRCPIRRSTVVVWGVVSTIIYYLYSKGCGLSICKMITDARNEGPPRPRGPFRHVVINPEQNYEMDASQNIGAGENKDRHLSDHGWSDGGVLQRRQLAVGTVRTKEDSPKDKKVLKSPADSNSDTEASSFSWWMQEPPFPGPPFLNSKPRQLRNDLVTSTVHYFWCKDSLFEFINYLSVLSVVKVIQPLQIIFHYTHLPVREDSYHKWFLELKHHLPQFVLHDLGSKHPCRSSLHRGTVILQTLEQDGGIYVGESTLIKNFTQRDWEGEYLKVWRGTTDDVTNGVIVLNKHKNRNMTSVEGHYRNSFRQVCCVQDSYDLHSEKCSCLVYSKGLYPKDIFVSSNKSAELSRWLAYGTTKPLTPRQDFKHLTPRISHFVWFGNRTFQFADVLSVLSSLYVAGMEKCYFHGDKEPTGKHWEYLLANHNVTFILMDFRNFIYTQELAIPQHSADVAKAYILLKYGGVTQDNDVYWVSRVPDRLLSFDTVVSYDWPKRNDWPETFNLGVMIAKPNSKFLANFLTTYRNNYRQRWDYNPIRMPYKTYERHPQSLYVDPHLQVITWGFTTHPTWVPGYIRGLWDRDFYGHPFNWRKETLSIHVTWPKPRHEFSNFSTLHSGSGMYSDIGRLICERAKLSASFLEF